MSIISLVHRYLLRGIGWLFAIGVLTALGLWFIHTAEQSKAPTHVEREVPR
jgi:hypothetical protein